MQASGRTTYFMQAMRSLRRAPGFVGICVGMLGLAIGATAAMFSVVDTVLLQRLPYADPERLVHIAASAPGSQLPAEFDPSPEFFLQYQEQSKLLEDVATTTSFTSTLRLGDRVERVRMGWPTSTLFSTLGVQPILGRLPVADDEDRVILLSHRLWETWFEADPGVIGRSLEVLGEPRTVVGIMAPDFQFPRNDVMLWISSTLRPSDIEITGDFDWPMIGRMVPGATPEAVAEELTRLARRAPERFGGSPAYARIVEQHRAVVRPLADQLLGSITRPLWVLLAATGVILLIACANVANLFLVRTEGRFRELAVRRALGASRGELLRLQMAEALLIAAAAGVVAVFMAALILPVFLQAAPSGVPRLDEVGLSPATLVAAGLLAGVSALICGGLPALRGASASLQRLRDGGRGTTGRRHWLRHALVVGQTALALVLLIGAGLLLRSVHELRQVDPGYDTADIFTFQIAPDRPALNDARSYARFHTTFMERLAALPGVQSVGLIENVPLEEQTAIVRFVTETNPAEGEGVLLNLTFAAGDYFGAMGIGVLAGRVLNADDHSTTLGNIVVSQSAARRLWPGLDPIGKRLRQASGSEWFTVVGVVEDVLQTALHLPPEPLVYMPMVSPAANGGRPLTSPGFVVRSTRADSLEPEIRALVREMAPEAPMYRVFTIEQLIERTMVQLTFTLMTLGIASVLALLLGAVGLYGVLSYLVAERGREIGVRMALGARGTQVTRLVVAQGSRVVLAGIAIGTACAIAFMPVLESLLYDVQPVDVATFLVMPLLMLMIGLLASYLPARRASNLDPVVSLRKD